jgi:hypothetical protein
VYSDGIHTLVRRDFSISHHSPPATLMIPRNSAQVCPPRNSIGRQSHVGQVRRQLYASTVPLEISVRNVNAATRRRLQLK